MEGRVGKELPIGIENHQTGKDGDQAQGHPSLVHLAQHTLIGHVELEQDNAEQADGDQPHQYGQPQERGRQRLGQVAVDAADAAQKKAVGHPK